ncbi:MAG TPA: hypothetical protein VJ001_08245 [Rhodocyclaceae bacterium]|nr:hypothetical protein [Rhodocyclaceae bacterium]
MSQGAICPRCGCDFTLAARAAEEAQRLLGRSIRALAQGDALAAKNLLAASRRLKPQPLERAVSAFITERAASAFIAERAASSFIAERRTTTSVDSFPADISSD